MSLRRPDHSARMVDGVSLGGSVVDFAKAETVMEYLLQQQYEDGSERQTSTLLVFVEDGRYKVCLNDREQGRSAWSSGLSILDALMALDESIASGNVEWRASRGSGRKR